MNSDTSSATAHPALPQRAEAAAWLARLHGPQRTAEVERGFRRWLRASPDHQRAFELLTERLEVAERWRTRSLPRNWRRSKKEEGFPWHLTTGIAATLTLIVAGALLYPRFAGVATAIGEQRILTLKDGTRVYLNTDTRVVVRYDEHRRLVELKNGEALFEVARYAGRPFAVISGGRKITALGTTFVVRREPRELSVILLEGKVAVASQTDSKVATTAAPAVLVPGQRLTLREQQPAKLDKPPLDKVTAWRQGQVALEDMPLSEAIVELNRYSTIKLIIERPETAPVRVGGFFRVGDSASFARAVAATYHLQVIERPREIVLAGLPQKGRGEELPMQ